MTPVANENGVIVLMRALFKELADRVLARLKPFTAERLRDRLASQVPDAPDSLERALREFADIQRIVDRVKVSPTIPTTETPQKDTKQIAPASSDDPRYQLRDISAEALLGVLRFEQPALVANVLSCLEAPAAAELLKRLPTAMRPVVTLKLSQPQTTNHELLNHLAKAVVAQSGVETTVPLKPTEDERVLRTAAMLRALPCDERGDVLKKMEEADANFAKKVADQLYQFTDILRPTTGRCRPCCRRLISRRLRWLWPAPMPS